MNTRTVLMVRRVLKDAAEIVAFQGRKAVYRLTVPGQDAGGYTSSVARQFQLDGCRVRVWER